MSALAVTAHAGTQNYTFSGATDYGQFTANATLDVENGFAVSGTGTISGDHLGQQTLTLLTAATPGAEVAGDGSFGYRSNGGTDFFGFDDAAPSDFLFALGPDTPAPGANLIFGIYDNGGGQYDSGLFGSSTDGTSFYEYDTPATLQAVSVSRRAGARFVGAHAGWRGDLGRHAADLQRSPSRRSGDGSGDGLTWRLHVEL